MRRIGLALALTGSLTLQVATAAIPPAPADFARYAETLLADAYRTDAPGVAVLVMRGDDVLYRGARGQADVAADVPLKPGDRFRIGSVTKQIAAAGLLTLVDAEKVSLDDPLSKYLPDYPDGAGVTVEQLLNHTSGIKDYTAIPGTFEGPIRRDLTTAQLVDYFKNETPEFAPGERWMYSNSGYVLVGAVIEAATGQPWHRYLDRALFKPLGMKDTGYGADPAVIERQVKGYTTDGKAPAPAQQLSMTQPHAAGALVSTVDDLARWSRALHGGRVLEPATYTRMITPVGKAKESGYGYGIETSGVRGAPVLQHRGGIPGFTSHLTYVPGADVTVAVLHNSETPSLAEGPSAIADDTFVYSDGFNRLQVLRDATGKVNAMRFWPEGEGDGTVAVLTDQALLVAITLPREAFERLAGVYTTKDVELRIVLDGEALSGHIKGQPLRAVCGHHALPLHR